MYYSYQETGHLRVDQRLPLLGVITFWRRHGKSTGLSVFKCPWAERVVAASFVEKPEMLLVWKWEMTKIQTLCLRTGRHEMSSASREPLGHWQTAGGEKIWHTLNTARTRTRDCVNSIIIHWFKMYYKKKNKFRGGDEDSTVIIYIGNTSGTTGWEFMCILFMVFWYVNTEVSWSSFLSSYQLIRYFITTSKYRDHMAIQIAHNWTLCLDL